MESTPRNFMPRQLASQAQSIVNNLEQTDYQHHDNIDVDNGIYGRDCNGFAGFVLPAAAPQSLRIDHGDGRGVLASPGLPRVVPGGSIRCSIGSTWKPTILPPLPARRRISLHRCSPPRALSTSVRRSPAISELACRPTRSSWARLVGTGWQGVGPANNRLYQTDIGAAAGTWDQPGAAPSGSFGYQDIEDVPCRLHAQLRRRDASVLALECRHRIMISYEDPESLTAKANYVLSKQLGGIMIWELAADDSQDTLANAIKAALSQVADGDSSRDPRVACYAHPTALKARGDAVMTLPEQIAALAESIVNTLTHTYYQRIDNIDPATGVYDCDCNGFVGFVLPAVAPQHFKLIPQETTQTRPRAFEYFDFFASLTPESTGGWLRIDLLMDARRGDIMAWRFPTIEADEKTGHGVIVAEPPTL